MTLVPISTATGISILVDSPRMIGRWLCLWPIYIGRVNRKKAAASFACGHPIDHGPDIDKVCRVKHGRLKDAIYVHHCPI